MMICFISDSSSCGTSMSHLHVDNVPVCPLGTSIVIIINSAFQIGRVVLLLLLLLLNNGIIIADADADADVQSNCYAIRFKYI